jgi:nitroreductase
MIFARRSIRRYQTEPVDQEDVRSLLEAAMAAPSANNSRPWSFVATTDKKLLKDLADAHPYGKMLSDAALAITVCADPSRSSWWVQDCSAATENILIAAAGLSLGGVWLGVYGRVERETAVRRILGIPDNVSVLCVIALGRPGESKEPRTQYDESVVHWEKW